MVLRLTDASHCGHACHVAAGGHGAQTWNQCDQIGRFFLHFGQLLKPLATMTLPKSLTFLGNFCKGFKIYHFSSEIIFGQLL